MSKIEKLKTLLIIGVWSHSGEKKILKDLRFLKTLFSIGSNPILKKNFKIVYKPHPNKKHSLIILMLLKYINVTVVNKNDQINDYIKSADCIVTWGSISTVFAILLKKQVIYHKNKLINFWVEYEKDLFEDNKLVTIARCEKEIVEMILKKPDKINLTKNQALIKKIFNVK